MTCIIGLIDKEMMYMIGDSAGVSGLDVRVRNDKKVFERMISTNTDIDEPMLIGFTTSFRMGQILMFCDLPMYMQYEDPFKYLVSSFVPSLISTFEQEGFLRTYEKEERDQKKGGTFLIAFKNRLFTIEDDFQVAELSQNYASVGCGAKYAWPCLQTIFKMDPNTSPKKALEMAMEISSENSGGVLPPFNLISRYSR